MKASSPPGREAKEGVRHDSDNTFRSSEGAGQGAELFVSSHLKPKNYESISRENIIKVKAMEFISVKLF